MEVVGILAGALTVAAFVPQAYKAVHTKKTRDLALSTYLILVLTGSLWSIYGIAKNDPAIYIANILVALLALTICIMKLIEG